MAVEATAILAAAGRGDRLGREPKQFLDLGGRPVIAWSAAALASSPSVSEMVVGSLPAEMERTESILRQWLPNVRLKVVAGGEHRQETVAACLAHADEKAKIVIIHDAARPFVTGTLIENTIEAARKSGAATLAIRPVDAVRLERGNGLEPLERERVSLIQTPQAFESGLIREAHERAGRDGFIGADDCILVERLGHGVELVLGSGFNFKITGPGDWELARALVSAGLVTPAGG